MRSEPSSTQEIDFTLCVRVWAHVRLHVCYCMYARAGSLSIVERNYRLSCEFNDLGEREWQIESHTSEQYCPIYSSC